MDAFFEYELPEELVAQQPSDERDESRLLEVRRADGALQHRRFLELPYLLEKDDLLVLNDTRVLPARLVGKRARTGGRWEGLFLGLLEDGAWELLTKTRGRLIVGETVVSEPGGFRLALVGKTPAGHWRAQPEEEGTPEELLAKYGHVPLPPYIRKGKEKPGDRERYQTIFAQRPGAVAAPTAGLHFTQRVFDTLKQRGVAWAFTTLHVGLGTFEPIEKEDWNEHTMHREWGELSAATAEQIAACKARGGRVVAVGTTTVRVLETAGASGSVGAWSGESELFIRPPYEFKVVDALVTNFHLPRSTLLLLVSAFAGPELVRRAYEAARAEKYRFYSYGDAMFIS